MAARHPLSLIFAVGRNHAIGRGGGLPWAWPEDTDHFARMTHGHAVIMGRRTWEEIGAPLGDRVNFVVTSDHTPRAGAIVVPSLDLALASAYAVDPSPFVIGGAQLFAAAMPLATDVWVTEIPEAPPDADTFFVFDATGFALVDERTTQAVCAFCTTRASGLSLQPVA